MLSLRRSAGTAGITVAVFVLSGWLEGAAWARQAAGQPIDPYAPAQPAPLPPPPLPPAPLPPLPAPDPNAAPPIDPYAPAAPYPPPPPTASPPPPVVPAPAPSGWDSGGCPAGCPQAAPAPAPSPPPLSSYTPVAPLSVEKRPRTGVMAAGIAILTGLWINSTVSGVLTGHHELIVPVIGPFLTARELNRDYSPSAGLSMVTGILVMDGLLQTAGLIMTIAGASVRVPVARRRPYAPPPPTVTPYGSGIGVRF
jgi:hypothetical protein